MIRAMQPADTPDLLALLNWMDDAPEREVFAPSSREQGELGSECEDSVSFVYDGDDGVQAYCAISPFRDGMVLEGPLSETGEHLTDLLRRAVEHAEGLPVYAFCARDNLGVRDALEAAGLTPMHATDFYSAPLSGLAQGAAVPADYALVTQLPIADYRALYRAAEDAWASRLDWSPEQYDAHFARDDVRLLVLTRAGKPAAFAELELNPEEARADVTHLAVHPAERGQKLGRSLLHLAAADAAQHPEMRHLRVRAHDHMHAARALYARVGLGHCRSIVTYMLDGEEEA
ncbi:hypothetical protein Dxin01_00380 [Deinococcus xinjiangensis]|uniref:N-acetyltransferase domain-containing protein n=1 Tax=Deinococcus xinjiangensis TaxID=457454 RepID=A0ABP9V5Y4_9DEIO